MLARVTLAEKYQTNPFVHHHDQTDTRTKVYLHCGSDGIMRVTLTFHQTFCGIIYPEFNDNSACLANGDGSKVGKINVPIYGCGTVQKPIGTFTNHLTIQSTSYGVNTFEKVTIICHYTNNTSSTTSTTTTTQR